MKSPKLLLVENLCVNYGPIRAVRNLHFFVEEGKVVGLIGANGAGKTSVLSAISGLAKGQGSVLFDNKELLNMQPYRINRLGVSLIPEGRRVFSNLTVKENLQMGAFNQRDWRSMEADYDTVFSLFPRLNERITQKAGTLSGGEQQMLAISRALMSRPRLLLMDEPSLGLAPRLVSEVFNAIKKINRQGTTILLVEQDAAMALKISDYAYVLETGSLALEGPSQELIANDNVRRAYLGIA